MTREDLDFIGSMNMCDEISNDAYKKIVCHCEEQEPILDKIETEIERLNPVDYGSIFLYEGHRAARNMKDDILRIIDKYKAESEDKEC